MSETEQQQEQRYLLTYGVKGAARANTQEYDTRAAAEAKAARWRSSNSTGDYWAEVTTVGGARWEHVIDAQRTVSLWSTRTGSIVITLEDPGEVAIVEMPRDDAVALRDELTRLLA